MLNISKKMRDLAKKINGAYWDNSGQSVVTKIKADGTYDIVYILSRRCFLLKNIETEEKTIIKKRNAVVSFFADVP